MATVRYTSINGRLIAEKRAGQRAFYVGDTLGSTIGLANSSGVNSDTFVYWPYGEIRTRTGSSASRFRYGGKLGYVSDLQSRIYIRAREYLSNYAQWMMADPIWPGLSPYAFARNAPTVYVDTTGFWAAKVDVPAGPGDISYAHSYIQFEHPCNGSKSYGFRYYYHEDQEAPNRMAGRKPGGVARSPARHVLSMIPSRNCFGESPFEVVEIVEEGTGAILFPDPRSRNFVRGKRVISRYSNRSEFERALCQCVIEALKHVPPYCFMGLNGTSQGFYVCGSWTEDMWACAKRRVRHMTYGPPDPFIGPRPGPVPYPIHHPPRYE